MKKEIITFREPKSPISEIFRTLRTNVQFANTKRGLHSLLITSTSPSEGKSWVSANLAVAFAQAGKKVILVDCDMRKGRQFSIFGVSPTPGLSNYLSGINSNGEESNPNILSYIKETEVENLYLITAGNIPPNPSELLVSEQMMQAVEELKSVCDLVIFDGTPSSLVTDAVIISRYVDTTLIVSAYKTTKMDDLEKVKREIENVGGRIAGVVINKMPTSQKQYYATYYYGNSNLSMKNVKKQKPTKKEQELQIERKKQELKEKSKNAIKQNKQQSDQKMEEYKTVQKEEPQSKIYDYEKENANVGNANVGNANVGNTNVGNTNVGNTNVGNTNVGNTNVGNANVGNTNVANANIANTNVGSANVENTNVGNANLQNANIENTRVNETIDSTELLKQMTQYVNEEKEKLKRGDNQ